MIRICKECAKDFGKSYDFKGLSRWVLVFFSPEYCLRLDRRKSLYLFAVARSCSGWLLLLHSPMAAMR